jgi:metal-responsive CopG/Arc/MetJ family transcriptional regulator
MTIRTTKIGISIPTEIFEAIENIRTKSNRSKFVVELLLPELNRRMRPVE